MYSWRMYMDAGTSCITRRTYLRCIGASVYVDKIFKEAKLADLSVERPASFGLIINLKTRRAPVLTIPPWLLFQADQVLQ
jgi:hypothetical protein